MVLFESISFISRHCFKDDQMFVCPNMSIKPTISMELLVFSHDCIHDLYIYIVKNRSREIVHSEAKVAALAFLIFGYLNIDDLCTI